MRRQYRRQRAFERQAGGVEIGGMLQLSDDPDRPPPRRRFLAHQGKQIVEAQHAIAPIVRRAVRSNQRHALAAAQAFQLCQGEIVGEPARLLSALDNLRGVAIGEVRSIGDVGGLRQFQIVADDQRAILRDQQIGLHEIGALRDAEAERGFCMLGQQPARAAMGDHPGLGGLRARHGRSGRPSPAGARRPAADI